MLVYMGENPQKKHEVNDGTSLQHSENDLLKAAGGRLSLELHDFIGEVQGRFDGRCQVSLPVIHGDQ